MSVLITGASGFIGSNVLKLLSPDQQKDIYCLTRRLTPEQKKQFPGVNWLKGDIADFESLSRLPAGISHIIHIAGSTSMWKLKEAEQLTTNVNGTENVCRFALQRNVEKLVFTSSVVTFGVHQKDPSEDTPSNAAGVPVNYYKTKLAAENVVKKYQQNGLRTVILNPTVVIGADDKVGWSRLVKLVSLNLMPFAGSGRRRAHGHYD